MEKSLFSICLPGIYASHQNSLQLLLHEAGLVPTKTQWRSRKGSNFAQTWQRVRRHLCTFGENKCFWHKQWWRLSAVGKLHLLLRFWTGSVVDREETLVNQTVYDHNNDITRGGMRWEEEDSLSFRTRLPGLRQQPSKHFPSPWKPAQNTHKCRRWNPARQGWLMRLWNIRRILLSAQAINATSRKVCSLLEH